MGKRTTRKAPTIGRHNRVPDSAYNRRELARGIKVELEHTGNRATAKAIAKDHLAERPDYYRRLAKVEGRPRDYKREYAQYHGKPEQRARRSQRNQARRKMGLKVGDGREVDHRRPLSRGGTNHRNNLRVVKRSTNRRKGAK